MEFLRNGGAMRDRTADLLRARQALSQLSYSPIFLFPWEEMVGRYRARTNPLLVKVLSQLS